MENNINMLSCPQGKPPMARAKNRYRGRLPTEPQTFCSLKEIKQKTMKIQQEKPTVCNNYVIGNY